mgnify:FL=1
MTVHRFWTNAKPRTAAWQLPAPAPDDDRVLGVSVGVKGRADWPLWRLERLLEAVAGAEATRAFMGSLRGLPRPDKRHRVNAQIEQVVAQHLRGLIDGSRRGACGRGTNDIIERSKMSAAGLAVAGIVTILGRP